MLNRLQVGEVPRKHHIALRGPDGALRFEECITQTGFDGPYTIAYHLREPHTQQLSDVAQGFDVPVGVDVRLAKRHFLTPKMARKGGSPLVARQPILFNADVTLGVLWPSESDSSYFSNADADDLYYIHEGAGTLKTVLGSLRFQAGDYVYVPRGLVHRFEVDAKVPQYWLSIELKGPMFVPKQWRNEAGQLRMDAPYCHRDFGMPHFEGPQDESIRHLVVKRGDQFHGFEYAHSPLDVVGWDGSVWPFTFPILNFQPRAGLVHLPPTWHGTFASRGVLVCSFVPRVVDFHPEAIPCPYPHASVDCDEFIFYCRGNFTSRRGVGPGSVSFHPAGVAHGPHPGAYAGSMGHKETNELAVMLDTFLPLKVTQQALGVEDLQYTKSFVP